MNHSSTRHAVLIDDEPLARMELRRLLQSHPRLEVVGEAGTIADSRVLLSRGGYDLVFLDVQLRGGTGFDLLDSVIPSAQVVFVTAHDRFALRAFDVNALDYLLKPVSATRLAATLQRLDASRRHDGAPVPGPAASIAPATHTLHPDDRVYVKSGSVTRFIVVGDIRAITSCENYTQLYLGVGETIMVLRPLKTWEEVLPRSHFVRIHRQTLVNLSQVQQVERGEGDEVQFRVKDMPAPLPASRRQLSELRHRFHELGLDGLLP